MSRRGISIRTLALFAAAVFALLAMTGAALAKGGGQLSSFGTNGTGNGQFNVPGMLGVDSADGTIYTGDTTTDKNNYRIQQLSPTGEFKASVLIPRFGGTNILLGMHGIAVDPVLDRIYVVESCKVAAGLMNCKATGSLWAAKQIRVYSTTPSGAALVPDPTTPTIPLPIGAEEIYFPQAIAVDPSSHDVVLFGEDSAKNPVVQRFGSAGAAGTRFVDSEKKLRPSGAASPVDVKDATSIAVGPTGVTYAMTGTTSVAGGTRAWRLPANLSTVEPVPGFAAAAEAEAWSAPMVNVAEQVFGGSQLAVSADGSTLYWKESVTPSESSEPGTILVRGYALASNETASLWGLGTSTCKITTSNAGIAAAPGGKLVVFDYGPPAEPPAYGNKVITFGAGGTGCPEPKAKFTINGKTEAETPTGINPGEVVSFNAASSELFGGFRRELIWKFGDGTEKTVKFTPGEGTEDKEAVTSTTRTYASAGTYTVRLEIKLSNAPLGNPPPVERTFTVGTPTTTFKLKVNKLGSGNATVTSTPSGINCGSTCEANINSGTPVTLVGTPDASSKPVVWSGCDSIVGSNECKVTMSAAKEVTATTDLALRQLAITKTGSGTGTVTSTPSGINCGATCNFDFDHGTPVTLVGAPGANTAAVVWTGCDEIVGSNECKVTMSAAKGVTADFPLVKRALTITKTGSGSGTVTSTPAGIDCGDTCVFSFDHNTPVTLVGTPGANTQAVAWSGCDSIVGSNECKVTMSAAKGVSANFAPVKRTLTITKTGSGTGTVTSTPSGINCGATCNFDFDHGTSVTLAGAPGANTAAVVWTGCDEIVGSNECKVTMSAAKGVSANFAPVKRTLTITKSGTGGGTVTSTPSGISCGSTCNFDFDHGTSVTLVGAPSSGSEAVVWTGCDSIVGSNECKVTMSAAKGVTAKFDAQPGLFQLKVKKQGTGTSTVTSNVGGINCGSTCETAITENTVVTLVAATGANSKPVVWSGCGEVVGSNECKVTMTAAKEVTATADLVQRQLTVTKTGAGTGTVTSTPSGISCGATCNFDFDHGTPVTLVGAPGANTAAVVWTGCDEIVGSNECKVTMSAAKGVSANFAPVKRQLTVTKSGSGGGTVASNPAGIDCGSACNANFDHGTPVTLTAAPAAGSEFKGWSGAGCSGTGTCVVTMNAASSVNAEFATIPVTPPPPETCATNPALCPPPEEKEPETKKPTPQEKLKAALKKCNKKKGKAKSRCVKAAKAKAKKEAKRSSKRPQLELRHERWWD